MADEKTYRGGCHCRAVRYRVTLGLDRVISCNCSICAAKGLLLAFAPAEAFVLESGADGLTDYQFNKKVVHHLSCKTCGVESFARGKKPDGADMVAINVRCLDGVDPSALKTMPFDGKKL